MKCGSSSSLCYSLCYEIVTFFPHLHHWQADQIGELPFGFPTHKAKDAGPSIYANLLGRNYPVVLARNGKRLNLESQDEAESERHRNEGDNILPPKAFVESLDSIGSSTDRIEEVDGGGEQEKAEEVLKRGVAGKFELSVAMIVDGFVHNLIGNIVFR